MNFNVFRVVFRRLTMRKRENLKFFEYFRFFQSIWRIFIGLNYSPGRLKISGDFTKFWGLIGKNLARLKKSMGFKNFLGSNRRVIVIFRNDVFNNNFRSFIYSLGLPSPPLYPVCSLCILCTKCGSPRLCVCLFCVQILLKYTQFSWAENWSVWFVGREWRRARKWKDFLGENWNSALLGRKRHLYWVHFRTFS